jgi:surfactin synthase thioesterase subunit
VTSTNQTALNCASQFFFPKRNSSAKMRVFCFPHAGGAPSVFFEWAARLGQEFECVCIQLRGRGSRLHEKSHEAIVDIADEIAGNITGYLDVPFVFYGHSFGGVIAFELARRMKREGKQGPAQLFLGAVRPPHLAPPHAPIHALPEREFIDNVQGRYSGIPTAVLREPEILQFFLPALRADFTAYERYAYRREEPLDCPITAFSGANDAVVTSECMSQWRLHTNGPFELAVLPGGHFFLVDSRQELIRLIRLRASAERYRRA